MTPVVLPRQLFEIERPTQGIHCRKLSERPHLHVMTNDDNCSPLKQHSAPCKNGVRCAITPREGRSACQRLLDRRLPTVTSYRLYGTVPKLFPSVNLTMIVYV